MPAPTWLEITSAQCELGITPIAQCPGVRRARLGDGSVRGALSAEIVRRIVHRHRHELLACHEHEQGRVDKLFVTIALSFTISSEGRIAEAQVQGGTPRMPRVRVWMEQAVKRRLFSAPEGGTVQVRFPVVLEGGWLSYWVERLQPAHICLLMSHRVSPQPAGHLDSGQLLGAWQPGHRGAQRSAART